MLNSESRQGSRYPPPLPRRFLSPPLLPSATTIVDSFSSSCCRPSPPSFTSCCYTSRSGVPPLDDDENLDGCFSLPYAMCRRDTMDDGCFLTPMETATQSMTMLTAAAFGLATESGVEIWGWCRLDRRREREGRDERPCRWKR